MRTNNKNNPVISKILMSYEELAKFESILSDLTKSLDTSIKNLDFNHLENIGKYARDMPKFTVFVEQADHLRTCIRKICTGEITASYALEKLHELHSLVLKSLELFNKEKIEELLK